MAPGEKDMEPGALASSPGEVEFAVMEPKSERSERAERGSELDNCGSYEPPTIRDLGSLRDLVASNGGSVMDSHGNGIEGS